MTELITYFHARSAAHHLRVVNRPVFCVVLFLSLVLGAGAVSVRPPSFDQLVNESDYIVQGVVKSVTPEDRVMPNGAHMIFSRVEVAVERVIAGQPPSPLVLEVLGGTLAGRTLTVGGVPRFNVGGESIFFVQGNGTQIFPLVRMMHGLYPIKHDAGTGREYVTRSDGSPLTDVAEVSRPVPEGSPTSASGKSAQLTSAQAEASALSTSDFVLKIKAQVTSRKLLEN